MASTLIIIVFCLGYTAIAFENPLKLNKAASALVMGVLCWIIYSVQSSSASKVENELMQHLGDISSILFFLLGAMTIVELIDVHNGFNIIVEKIATTSKRRLLLIITVITFLLSSILNNMTTVLVMVSLCNRLLSEKEDRMWFAGIIVIAANAGGVWSPLGDVTTTMLWIGGQISPLSIMKNLLLPSLAVCIIPAMIISFRFKGKKLIAPASLPTSSLARKEGILILFAGISLLLFVPVFKSVTRLPPFMGMLLALGVMWVITSFLHKDKQPDDANKYAVSRALQRIDSPSILFFLGILLAVASLESFGLLEDLSFFLDKNLKNEYGIGTAFGLVSSVVDNVPLVAATQGMYGLATYPTDHSFWQFITLTTGTGGSLIIIGSAAGIAAMSMEKIPFGWYLKKIGWLALIGFASGIGIFILEKMIG